MATDFSNKFTNKLGILDCFGVVLSPKILTCDAILSWLCRNPNSVGNLLKLASHQHCRFIIYMDRIDSELFMAIS